MLKFEEIKRKEPNKNLEVKQPVTRKNEYTGEHTFPYIHPTKSKIKN